MNALTGPPLVVYTDLACPYSALASYRASWLERIGQAAVEFRLVRGVAAGSSRSGRTQGGSASLHDEVAAVRELLADGEVFPIRVPPRLPVGTHAAARFAAVAGRDARLARDLRVRLFRAVWLAGRDVDDPAVLDQLGMPPAVDTDGAGVWQDAWTSLADPVVPLLVTPEGDALRGRDALARLREMRLDSGHNAASALVRGRPQGP